MAAILTFEVTILTFEPLLLTNSPISRAGRREYMNQSLSRACTSLRLRSSSSLLSLPLPFILTLALALSHSLPLPLPLPRPLLLPRPVQPLTHLSPHPRLEKIAWTNVQAIAFVRIRGSFSHIPGLKRSPGRTYNLLPSCADEGFGRGLMRLERWRVIAFRR